MKLLKTALKLVSALGLTAIVVLLAMMSGAFHAPTSFHEFAAFSPATGPVLVVGATQKTGLEVVRELVARGQPVVATVRASSNTAALDALGVQKVSLDALDERSVRAAIVAGRYSAVISTVGVATRPRPARANIVAAQFEEKPKADPEARSDFVGNRNVIDAARDAGIRRFVLVTVIGTGNSFSYIARKDLARLVVDALGDPSTIGHTYTSWDPSRLNVWNLFMD